jgi:bifunctional enzyme CysN/CysC
VTATSSAAGTSELVRVATAGSVDDGKSTLIGRLLFETGQIMEDQLAHVEQASLGRGDGYVNLALLTDGLRAEREQGITIDVAYRYFQTPRRKFVLADTPGHEQYTRNMVTGASTADVALILVDARNGVVEQSRRHALIASLLRIPHIVVCVNKMDLVGFDEAAVDAVRAELPDAEVIPVSALQGDNVVDRSERMPWYDGPSLLEWLEGLEVASDRNLDDLRFPVQWVIRPNSNEHHDYRGYAGQIASGVVKPGDEVTVLPSGRITRVTAIDTADGELDEAFPPLSVTLRLLDGRAPARGRRALPPEAHHALGAREGRRGGGQARRAHARGGPGPRRPRAERPRPRAAAPRAADLRRLLRVEPGHRQLHPDRRELERDGRRGNGVLAWIPAWSSSGSASACSSG